MLLTKSWQSMRRRFSLSVCMYLWCLNVSKKESLPVFPSYSMSKVAMYVDERVGIRDLN